MELLTPYLGKGIIGIGLGGDEKNYPTEPFEKVFKEAQARGFRTTVHAGEGAGAKSICAAIDKLGAERIGHGVRLIEDMELLRTLKEKRIPLEMCVSSNVVTRVCGSMETHPIKEYFSQGLYITVNSDDPTMFNTTISNEFLILTNKLGFTIKDLKQLILNSINASFMLPKDKELMKHQIETEWELLLINFSK